MAGGGLSEGGWIHKAWTPQHFPHFLPQAQGHLTAESDFPVGWTPKTREVCRDMLLNRWWRGNSPSQSHCFSCLGVWWAAAKGLAWERGAGSLPELMDLSCLSGNEM